MIDALIISNIVLWAIVIVMGFVILALVRQIGILYERVAPAGALMVNQTLSAGDPAPALTLITIDQRKVAVGGAGDNGRSTLLFFLAPDCPVCKTLIPVLKSARKAEAGWLDIILASDGQAEQHRGYIREQGLGDFDYVLSEILGKSYGVGKLPYGVLIDENGTVATMGIINSREHLESLFEAKEHGVASIQAYMGKHVPEQSEVEIEQGAR